MKASYVGCVGGRAIPLEEAATRVSAFGLVGWPLVEHAQRLVHEQFREYSCLHWWESPAAAFSRRRGYCAQYNGALAEVLAELDIDCRLVHAFRVRLVDDPSWRMGHVWVQVRVEGEVRDVCAGSAWTREGKARFEPLTPVRRFGRTMRLVTAIGMAPIVAGSLAWSVLTGKPRAAWLHHALED